MGNLCYCYSSGDLRIAPTFLFFFGFRIGEIGATDFLERFLGTWPWSAKSGPLAA